jgi:phage terminase large subunit
MKKVNPNLLFLRENWRKKRILILQGGTRSGKTYSAIQFLIEFSKMFENAGMVITICRATFPSLRASVYRDFIDILNSYDYYFEENHNKTEHTYLLYGNLFEFISIDQPQKVRSRKRDVMYACEVNEFDVEKWRQLMFRTSGFVMADFNPSDPQHFIYDEQERDDAATLITTYKDNPFLTAAQITEIERLKDIDEEAWAVFGLGERAKGRKGQIFQHFKEIDSMPEMDGAVYGLDFGYSSDPTAMVKVITHNGKMYIEEVLYTKALTNDDIFYLIREKVGQSMIYADSAEPKSIEQLRRLGLNVREAVKGQGSINNGIDRIKSMEVFVTKSSRNIWNEQLWYRWKLDKEGNSTNVPNDSFNHAMDAIRYAISHQTMNKPFFAF